jgi:hypothetical protein
LLQIQKPLWYEAQQKLKVSQLTLYDLTKQQASEELLISSIKRAQMHTLPFLALMSWRSPFAALCTFKVDPRTRQGQWVDQDEARVEHRMEAVAGRQRVLPRHLEVQTAGFGEGSDSDIAAEDLECLLGEMDLEEEEIESC